MRLLWCLFLSLFLEPLSAWATETPQTDKSGRIELLEQGFSIIPPVGWRVSRNSHGSSLLIEAPTHPSQIYQPTIQLMVFNGPRYIDSLTQKEFGDLIEAKFSKVSNHIENFHLRSSQILPTEAGDPSILYYTEFQYDKVSIMQMHVLISSESHHFLMTYTDLAKVFEDDNSPGLTLAYGAMHSAQVSTKPAWRYRDFALIGAGILGLIIFWIGLQFFRSRRIAKLGQRIEYEEGREVNSDEESTYYSQHSKIGDTEHGYEESRQSASRAKAKPKAQTVPGKESKQVFQTEIEDDDEYEVSEAIPLSELQRSHPSKVPFKNSDKPSQISHSALARPSIPTPRPAPPPMIPPAPLAPIVTKVLPSLPSLPSVAQAESVAPKPLDLTASFNNSDQIPYSEERYPAIPLSSPRDNLHSSHHSAESRRPETLLQSDSSQISEISTTRNPPQRSKIEAIKPMSHPTETIGEAEPEMTEEARLSEILPKAGTIAGKTKQRGFFWGKKHIEEDEDFETATTDSWMMDESKSNDIEKQVDQDNKTPNRDSWSHQDATRRPLTEQDAPKDQWSIDSISTTAPLNSPPVAEDYPEEPLATQEESPAKNRNQKTSQLDETRRPETIAKHLAPAKGTISPTSHVPPTHMTHDGWNLDKDISFEDDENEEDESV
ncbi:MAG: hypothetical protein NTX25_05140 [Proteobacteria bacterium]|nr:hypothetical protein [Pseudomonadota bacterium]